MKKEALKFKRFLEDNNSYEEFIQLLSDKKRVGAIAYGGSVSSFFENTAPYLYIVQAFSIPADKKWTRLAREWMKMINNKPVKKISDFIKKEGYLTVFKYKGFRAELNPYFDEILLFVDIEGKDIKDIPTADLVEDGLKYIKEVLNELK